MKEIHHVKASILVVTQYKIKKENNWTLLANFHFVKCFIGLLQSRHLYLQIRGQSNLTLSLNKKLISTCLRHKIRFKTTL
ncbi:CLUMA_CG021508, isoform A [Clunio marinus]|uniref:CLUMA_CG021508, isoform A n=1 Tax=Clunio marinus TaxID=568069 RepID=A0A1J1J831_9DIPT|nr:CLUMA_CG021508, isoform A [Clunio marinus]